MNTTENNTQATNEFNQVMKPISLWADAWKRLRRNRMALISLWIVLAYIVISLAAPMLTSMGLLYDYKEQVIMHANLPPSFKAAGALVIDKIQARIALLEETIEERKESMPEGGTDASGAFVFDFGSDPASETDEAVTEDIENDDPDMLGEFVLDFGGSGSDTELSSDPLVNELNYKKADLATMQDEIENNPLHKRMYLFGTDDLGRDMLARTIYGGRISIAIGLVGTITAVLIGIVYGAIAGYIGAWLDNLMMRFVDLMYSLPYMLIIIILMAVVGEAARGSFVMLFVAIALVSWLTIARVVRGQVISLKNAEFVEAARSMGAGTMRIIFRHLLPNTLGVIIVFSTLLMPSFIMNESFLSFLGLGVSAPQASWGTLVSEGVRAMELRVWQLLVPAFSMTIFLFAMNFLGDGLRDALDPQSKNRA